MSTDSALDLLRKYIKEEEEEEGEEEIKSISSMYFKCDVDGALHLIAVDKGATDVTGYTPEELVATGMMTLMDLIAPKSRADLRYNIQQGLGERRAFASWFVMRRKDSSTTRAFIQGKGNVSKDLQLISIEGYIAADTTVHGEFTTESVERSPGAMTPPPAPTMDPGYVHLLNYSEEILGLINKLDEIEYITPIIGDVSNITRGDHQLFASIFSPDSSSLIEETLQKVRETGEKIDGLQVYFENKEKIPIIVSLSLSPAGSHSSATLFRIEMPRSSRSSDPRDEMYHQSFLSNTMGMIIAEHDTKAIVEVNTQFLSLFEYDDRNKIINHSILELAVFDQTDITRINDVIEIKGMAKLHQIEGTTQQGNIRQILISAYSLRLSAGTYIVYSFEEAPLAQEIESEQKSGDQISGDQIAYEELTTLLSLLKMTSKKGERNDIIKCEALLTSVLYLHDPTCQDIDGERITMDVYLGKITKSCIEKYAKSGIEYEFICDSGFIFDRALAQAFGFVTVEFISNSLHHAFEQGETGKITVSMIRDETEGNYLLSVIDTGSGMPQTDEIEECGLSVVRDIANSLRGSVEITPTGKGAHITMAVPIPVLSGL